MGLTWKAGSRLKDLDFADDIALLTNSWNDKAQLTKNNSDIGEKSRSTDAAKTKLMKVRWWVEDGAVKVKEEEMEHVSAFWYLGSHLSNDSSCDNEVKVRIGEGNAAFET